MKTTTRVNISTLIMFFIIIFLGATGYFGFTSMHKKIVALEEISNELDEVSHLNLSLHEAVSYLNNYLVTGDPDERRRYKKASSEVKESFERVAAYEPGDDASLENAKRLYANIDKMAEELFEYEVPLDSKDAVTLMSEIQQTADWISRLYIQIHQIKDRGKLDRIIIEADVTRRWVDRVQITGAISALIMGLILILYKRD